MRKSNIDNSSQWNRNFILACIANFLLYASTYAVLVYYSFDACIICPMFILGMLLVGPFHAWLADRFRRKRVLSYPFVGMALVMLGYAYASAPAEFYVLALVQGMCFGLSLSAGITVSIDVVQTGHRTVANRIFAVVGRLGMAVGLLLVELWMGAMVQYKCFIVFLVAMSLVGGLIASLIYLPFRAPIGLSVCSLDRYLLGRAWLPALNVGLLGFVVGAAILHLLVSSVWLDAWGLLFLFVPVLVLLPFVPGLVQMFVKLCHHCQRATGNMTFNLCLDVGVFLGFWYSSHKLLSVWSLGAILVAAVLMYVSVTRIYYKKMRVR